MIDDSYLKAIEGYTEDQTKRRKLELRPYADYEREVRGASGLDELVILHGPPKTADDFEIIIGMAVYRVVDEFNDDREIRVIREVVENFDWIFEKWMFKLAANSCLYGSADLYSTRLAATSQAITLYRYEIDTIEAKINALAQNM